ncbi:MAG TPA: TIGR00366 family protein [Kofleriaceae bacterium]|nr:TIGR00366 family protein [Kofleriaceae bacterium]
MIARIGSVLNRWSRRWVPDPFVLALGLTLLVAVLGAVRWSQSGLSEQQGLFETLFLGLEVEPGKRVGGWFTELTNAALLAFALKMALILVTGHALALSPPVQRAIGVIASIPRTAAQATVLVSVVACGAALIHWGLGAIAGALLAREIGRHAAGRGLTLHYPLLGAAAYAGFAVWHGGLTGSAPTMMAGAKHLGGDLVGAVPMSDTVFGGLNLIVTGTLLVTIPLLFWALTPRDAAEFVPPDPDQLAPLPPREAQPVESWVHWLQESWAVGLAVGALGSIIVIYALLFAQLEFELDSIVLLFLFLSLLMQGSIRHYVDAIADGARGAGAILLQFPFYFGILGIMKATGMIAWISDAMVEVSSKATLPVVAYLSAGLVNLMVPSGGGQWAVQGDVLLSAGHRLGVDPATTIMAFSYGDAWTNMLQPFWALPLLGIMGLRARDIIGYTAIVFVLMAVVVPILLLALG